MKEKPILFSTEMVKAILEDRKTQTRRVIKPQPSEIVQEYFGPVAIVGVHKGLKEGITCPYGQPGDLLWVRETIFKLKNWYPLRYAYVADQTENETIVFKFLGEKITPSIHMPKAAARIWLEITDVKIERVHDISEKDAIAEGIELIDQHGIKVWKRYDVYGTVSTSPVMSFWSLWASINGEDSWQQNPWVWVITFKALSKTGRPQSMPTNAQ